MSSLLATNCLVITYFRRALFVVHFHIPFFLDNVLDYPEERLLLNDEKLNDEK
jgi:hypothetical protein